MGWADFFNGCVRYVEVKTGSNLSQNKVSVEIGFCLASVWVSHLLTDHWRLKVSLSSFKRTSSWVALLKLTMLYDPAHILWKTMRWHFERKCQVVVFILGCLTSVTNSWPANTESYASTFGVVFFWSQSINTFSIMVTRCEVYEASLKILNFDLVKSNQRFSDLIEMWKGVGAGDTFREGDR